MRIRPEPDTVPYELDLLDGWAEGTYLWPVENGSPPEELRAVLAPDGPEILEPGDTLKPGETAHTYHLDHGPTWVCGSEGCATVYTYWSKPRTPGSRPPRRGFQSLPARALPPEFQDITGEPGPSSGSTGAEPARPTCTCGDIPRSDCCTCGANAEAEAHAFARVRWTHLDGPSLESGWCW